MAGENGGHDPEVEARIRAAHKLKSDADGKGIPPEKLDGKREPIPPGKLVVFYCAEPEESTSARIAGLLNRHGYRNVRPLRGGLEAWRHAGFPVEPIRADISAGS